MAEAAPGRAVKKVVIACASVFSIGDALAAGPGIDALFDRIDGRSFRRESRVDSRDFKLFSATSGEAAPAPIRWSLSLGASYTDGEDGSKTTSSPFLLKGTFNNKNSFVKLSGDGLTNIKSGSEVASGLADFTASLGHVLYRPRNAQGDAKVVGEIGYTVPTHSAVGSAKGKERLGLSYSGSLSPTWFTLVSAKLTRYDADPRAGVSRVTRSGQAHLVYGFPNEAGRDIDFALARNYRPGVGGSTQVSATYEFPLTVRGARGPIGALGYARGISRGSRDNTMEFDVAFQF